MRTTRDVDDAYVDNAARVFRFVAIGGDWASRLAASDSTARRVDDVKLVFACLLPHA